MATQETTGWTFTKGNVGDEVDASTVIFSSKSCLRVLRTGKNPTQAVTEVTGLSDDEAKEVIKDYKKEQTEYQKEKEQYNIRFNELQTDYVIAQKKYNEAREVYNNHVYSNMYGESIGLPAEFDTTKEFDELNKLETDMKAKEKVMTDYSKAFHDKWKTSTALTEAVTPTPPIIESQKEIDSKLEKLTEQINNMDLNMTSTAQVTAWFDAVEQYIDSMPQFKEDTTELYEVEKKGTKWVYTGNSAIPDPEFNLKMREWKKEQCKKLNSLIESVTKKLEKTLNSLAKKCVWIYPLINAIKVIQGGVSIDTLVKWGKAVIDFCTSLYQMFYTTYRTVMEVMELIVVRVPQLISKLMSKVTELDCPVGTHSVKVNFPSNATTANKNKKKK